jgi:hypothetical protein
MQLQKKRVIYKAFGLNLLSDIPMPELNYDSRTFKVDVVIKKEDLSHLWNESYENSRYIFKGNSVMFEVGDLAIFSIQDGHKIIVSPKLEFDEEKARLYILGTCMGALLMQRKVYPLHGSAIVIDGMVYAIVGDSGVGKSTLASTFLKKGYKLLSDDVIAISFSNSNIPHVVPSYPQQKLWDKSLEAFGMPTSHFKPLFERETKYAIPVHSNFYDESLPLAGVIELNKIEGDQINFNKVSGMNCLKTLYNHTFRNFFLQKLGLLEWHFQESIKIVHSIDMYELQRPNSSFTAFELADMILNKIDGGKKDVNTHTFIK